MTKLEFENLRIYIKNKQREAENTHHPEHMRRLLAAFRAGENGHPLEVRNKKYNVKLTAAIEFAWRAGTCYAKGDNAGAIVNWRGARFSQGKLASPIF